MTFRHIQPLNSAAENIGQKFRPLMITYKFGQPTAGACRLKINISIYLSAAVRTVVPERTRRRDRLARGVDTYAPLIQSIGTVASVGLELYGKYQNIPNNRPTR